MQSNGILLIQILRPIPPGVENQLQDMDINNLIEDTVEYTTRSDWSKGWEPIESLTPTEAMMVGLTDQLYELTENEGDGSGITWGADNGMKLIDMMQFDENGNYAGALDFVIRCGISL